MQPSPLTHSSLTPAAPKISLFSFFTNSNSLRLSLTTLLLTHPLTHHTKLILNPRSTLWGTLPSPLVTVSCCDALPSPSVTLSLYRLTAPPALNGEEAIIAAGVAISAGVPLPSWAPHLHSKFVWRPKEIEYVTSLTALFTLFGLVWNLQCLSTDLKEIVLLEWISLFSCWYILMDLVQDVKLPIFRLLIWDFDGWLSILVLCSGNLLANDEALVE